MSRIHESQSGALPFQPEGEGYRPRPRRGFWETGLSLAAMLGTWTLASPVHAEPTGPVAFCEAYPSSPDCLGGLTTCSTCHVSTDPPLWNTYGASLIPLVGGQDFDGNIVAAMASVEDFDADGDGEPNLEEILVGTNPGRADSLWQPVPDPDGENPWYELDGYDPKVAYRRAKVLYCGSSPTYEELESFRALPEDSKREALHEALAVCLDGEYWRGQGLAQLGDKRIRPVFSVGAETQVVFSGLRLVLADYEWDYRLWRYILSDDRDMRELLTAQYHVEADPMGGLTPVDGPVPNPLTTPLGGGQPLESEHRAGMITTQWFLMSNTMFSDLPRTTAAQAYRSYLGMDISSQEGIIPVANEPRDVDHKGVAAPACAQCHATLDPLAYAFAYFHGIEFPGTGTYDATRPGNRMVDWNPDVHQTIVLGEPVSSVAEWGRVAAESSYFRRAMARTLFEHAVGRNVGPEDYDDLVDVADTMVEDGHSANRLIHRIVDTAAFGAP